MNSVKLRYSQLNTIIQRVSSTRPVSWFFARNLHRIDEFFLRLSNGRMTLTHYISGLPVVILTTTGARSGKQRSTPLAYIHHPNDRTKFVVIASNFGQPRNPAWYYNLKVHRRAIATIDQRKMAYIAYEAEGEEYSRFWKIALEIYPGYQLYQQWAGERHIPIMVLTAEEE